MFLPYVRPANFGKKRVATDIAGRRFLGDDSGLTAPVVAGLGFLAGIVRLRLSVTTAAVRLQSSPKKRNRTIRAKNRSPATTGAVRPESSPQLAVNGSAVQADSEAKMGKNTQRALYAPPG